MKLPDYPKYKPSGTSWFGDVPEGWGVYSMKYSLAIPITDGPHETPEILDAGVPFLSAEAVKNGQLDFEKKRGFISIEDHKRFSKKYRPVRGDVYMVKSGATTGNVARVETDNEFNIWSPLAAIRPDLRKAITDFIYYSMLSKPFFYSVELSWSYGTQQNIGMGVVANLGMAWPSVDEQQKIADFLNWKTGQIDELITKKKQLIEKLKEKRIALITQAVTKGLNAEVPMRDSGIPWLGNVPEHWEVIRLKFCITVAGGGTPNTNNPDFWDGDIPWVSPKDMKSLYISNTEDNITVLGLQESATAMVATNTVLIVVRSGILRHTIPVALNTVPVTINQDMKALKPLRDILDASYLRAIIFGNQRALIPIWSKPGCTVESIEMEYMLNSEIPLPPIDEQISIAKAIKREWVKIDRFEATVEAAITRLIEYRTALITAATTGKIDVRNVKIGGNGE